MEYMFYTIKRKDGDIIDEHNQAPYLICNDYEDAVDTLDALPEGVQYLVESVTVNADLCDHDLTMETE